MKIAVPTNDGVTISPHFGRSAAFVVCEVEDGEVKSFQLRPNAPHPPHAEGACGHENGGEQAGHSHEGILAAIHDCSVVICAGMGWRAAEALKQGGIVDIAIAAPQPVQQAVAAYISGTLPPSEQGFCRCSH